MAPDRTPERVVAEAQKLLGIGENPPGSNCNWITQRFGLGCVAWCDEGWWTALFNAGFNDGQGHIDMPGVHTDYALGDAYVPNTMRHFQAGGRFSPTPVPGAGEIHFWGGGEGNSHVAMYVSDYGDGTHLNIECNHNNVCEYVRRSNSDPTIMGYCIPAYVTTTTPQEDDVALPNVPNGPTGDNAFIEIYNRIKNLEAAIIGQGPGGVDDRLTRIEEAVDAIKGKLGA